MIVTLSVGRSVHSNGLIPTAWDWDAPPAYITTGWSVVILNRINLKQLKQEFQLFLSFAVEDEKVSEMFSPAETFSPT